jgi:hypothetical protein
MFADVLWAVKLPRVRCTGNNRKAPKRARAWRDAGKVESKNMAAQDNAREKFDPIARKFVGTTDQQQAIQVKRLDIREIMGTKLLREITLK